MKSYADWNGSGLSLEKFINPGEETDEEMFYYFLEVLPPAAFGRNFVQCGEPQDHCGKNGAARYTTIARATANSPWIYLGYRDLRDIEIR